MRDAPFERDPREQRLYAERSISIWSFYEKGLGASSNSYAFIGNYRPVSLLQGATLKLLTNCSSALR